MRQVPGQQSSLSFPVAASGAMTPTVLPTTYARASTPTRVIENFSRGGTPTRVQTLSAPNSSGALYEQVQRGTIIDTVQMAPTTTTYSAESAVQYPTYGVQPMVGTIV